MGGVVFSNLSNPHVLPVGVDIPMHNNVSYNLYDFIQESLITLSLRWLEGKFPR